MVIAPCSPFLFKFPLILEARSEAWRQKHRPRAERRYQSRGRGNHLKKAPHNVIGRMKDRKNKKTYSINRNSEFAHLLDSFWHNTDDVPKEVPKTYEFTFSDDMEEQLDHLLEYWSSPSAWYLKGRKFRKAARILHTQTIGIKGKHNNLEPDEDDLAPYYSIDEVITFLMGVAIENLFKGILTAKGAAYEDLATKDRHNIKHLYRRCKRLYGEEGICEFSIEPEHYLLLDVLTLYIRWVGRYTRPKRDELVKLMVTVGINEGEGIVPARTLRYDDLGSFYERLASYLDFELRRRKFSTNMPYVEHISF